MLTLRQHLVQHDTADHRAQRGRRHTLGSSFEVPNLQHTFRRLEYFVIPKEVNGDGGVIFGDRGLVRDLTHLFPQVSLHATIDEGDEEYNARTLGANTAAQAEDHQALVLIHDANSLCHEHQANEHHCT